MSQSGQDLLDIINSSNRSIADKCQTVDKHLSGSSDNLRGFFENCFPVLVKCIFGYDRAGWLSDVSKTNQASDFKAIVQLLGPSGNLFAAMNLADNDRLIQYVFPEGPLPVMTQIFLRTEAGQKELERWPQYEGCLVPAYGGKRIQLKTLQYFLLWTAFYVLRTAHASSSDTMGPRPPQTTRYGQFKQSLPHVTLPGKLGKGPQQGVRCHPYQTLLQMYLSKFLPRNAAPASGKAGQYSRGELLFSVLLEFWLTDGEDPSLKDPKDSRLAPPLPYEAPTPQLLEAMQEVVRYTVAVHDGDRGQGQQAPGWAQATPRSWLPLPPLPQLGPPQQPGPPRLMAAGQPPFQVLIHHISVLLLASLLISLISTKPMLGQAVLDQSFAKRLYRFLRRAMTRWPEQQPIGPLINLYLAYIAPWGVASVPEASKAGSEGASKPAVPLRQLHNMEGLVHRVLRDKPNSSPSDKEASYVPPFHLGQWEGHILSSLPFYMLLLPLLLQLIKSRVSTQAAKALQDLAKVLVVFKAAPELCNLLKAVEEEYRRGREGGLHQRSRLDGPYADVLPWIQSQASVFETGAKASCRDVQIPLAEHPAFMVFSKGEQGGAALVRSILNRAVGAPPDSVKQVEECALGWLPMEQLGQGTQQHAPQAPQSLPSYKTVKKGSLGELQFKGDLIDRPPTSREWAWLMRRLVALSKWGNAKLGLDRPPQDGEIAETQIKEIQLWMRRKGYRVNLRYLAEVQTLGFICLTLLALWLFGLFCSWIWGLTSDLEPGHPDIRQLEVQRQYSSQPSTYHYNPDRPSTYRSQHIHNAPLDL